MKPQRFWAVCVRGMDRIVCTHDGSAAICRTHMGADNIITWDLDHGKEFDIRRVTVEVEPRKGKK